MKILVVYYSKTGTTRKLAERIAAQLNADVESIVDTKKRSGLIGWLVGGRDGMRKISTTIDPVSKNAADYDLVLIGGPLWGFKSVAPAARTYLKQHRSTIKKAGFFITCGGTSPDDAFNDLKELYGKPVAGILCVKQHDINDAATAQKVKEFSAAVASGSAV
jgi:flavodoxin